jgi:hypothetical protein
MTTVTVPAASAAASSAGSVAVEQPSGTGAALRVAAGVALVAGPVLFSLGMFTCPPQASMADTDYVTSLARDTTLTQVSALFLHYANIAIGLGLLAAPALIRGRRGRVPAVLGALLGVLGFVNVSGQILSDWWNMSAGRVVGVEQAAVIFHGVKSASLMPFWDATEAFSLLGPVLVFVGLARAGVLGWWTLPVFVGGVVGLMLIPVQMIALVGVVVLVGFSPIAFIGVRLLQRARAGVA